MAIQIVREISADVVKRNTTKTILAKQGDLNSRFLNVRIQEDGKDIVIDPALMVLLNVDRPDRSESVFYGTVNADGTVKVPLTAWMLEIPGALVCDISIVSEDVTVARLTTMQFSIYVEAAVVTDESIVDTDEYNVIVDLLNRVSDAEKQVNEAIARTEGLTMFIPEVSEDGTLSWSNDKGYPNPDPVNIKGPKGADGATPERGTDYWTLADQQAIVNEILSHFTDASEVAM